MWRADAPTIPYEGLWWKPPLGPVRLPPTDRPVFRPSGTSGPPGPRNPPAPGSPARDPPNGLPPGTGRHPAPSPSGAGRDQPPISGRLNGSGTPYPAPTPAPNPRRVT
ncbi:hypothetical protein GCM10010206_46770 [Streptomyces cinerochromogenes]|nr:hypothetical protein GCM10010206_46770 [Streptomyces cinerochromogenes]